LHILILGYSNLFRRRIHNVLIKKNIRFSIASKSSNLSEKKAYKWYRNYLIALKNSDADIVYISLANSNHYYWAKKALENGYHVIVDKPLSKNYSQTKNLVQLAKSKKRLIAEATFFNYHKQFKEAVKFINGINNIKYINANFIIPFPKKNSLLMSKKLLGGCLMDMGPYAAAIPRLFCSGKLIKMKRVIVKNKKGLITSFSILCQFKKNLYHGFFCFGGEYKSSLVFISKNKYVELNRVFSPPPDKRLTIIFKKKDKISKKVIGKENVIENFLQLIKNSLNKNKYKYFYQIALQDAKFRDKILLKE
tara:strand:- start:3347 stop:4267 length:921 start_codon:yes stop_codon:yes gene_type:complete